MDKDLNKMTKTIVKTMLENGFGNNERIITVLDKSHFWSVVLHHPGLYYEPPRYWRTNWINFENHEVNIRISKADFDVYFCSDMVAITQSN